MLKKLRIKFIAIIMAAVTVILTAVFASICVINWQQNVGELDSSLDGALQAVALQVSWLGDVDDDFDDEDEEEWDGEIGRHWNDRDTDRSQPLAVYRFTDDGFSLVSHPRVRVGDAALERAASLLHPGENASGIIDEYELCYQEKVIAGTTYVAFTEAAFLPDWKRLVFMLGLVEVATLVVFFGVALLFSRWALRPVERAWRQQRQFVGDAAHDLKTPLTVILANSAILLEEPSMEEAERAKWIRSTQAEARGMQTLVEDMLLTMAPDSDEQLTAAKAKAASAEAMAAEEVPFSEAPSAEAGDGAAVPEADGSATVSRPSASDVSEAPDALAASESVADLSRIALHELLQFESVAYERSLVLEDAIEEHCIVAQAPAKAKRLMTILLDNACKYANEGGEVRVSLEREESSGANEASRVCLRVFNTGTPIAPEALPKVFDRFYRGDAARTSREGHGLGLAIAHTVVEEAGGSLGVESDAAGTVFTARLPEAR
ncbi:cell wall metabolism sensor histidine kinase WalK [uncultured Adlercreutzia sp.]|uniref:sensor histidine kinase n=2 Tax=uncultured Adlercreutzia sp. TaxID=875803 RepID=UPI0025FB6B3D|nr:HAMP domain-containing sensor histidine kinase [uncultured Adlercreutzia sp.]MCI9262293.1 HAMP domain-containing histidine kinase [Eggerthellaceae bacterium]